MDHDLLSVAKESLVLNLDLDGFFGLTFLFCCSANKEALFQLTEAVVSARQQVVRRPRALNSADLKDQFIREAVAPAEPPLASGGVPWLDMDAQLGNAAWDAQRLEFLYRVNERRAALSRSWSGCHLIFAFPPEWTKQVAQAAPDLWTIRSTSVYAA